jgi:hypothetical protein
VCLLLLSPDPLKAQDKVELLIDFGSGVDGG